MSNDDEPEFDKMANLLTSIFLKIQDESINRATFIADYLDGVFQEADTVDDLNDEVLRKTIAFLIFNGQHEECQCRLMVVCYLNKVLEARNR